MSPHLSCTAARDPPDSAADAVGHIEVAALVEREPVREQDSSGARQPLARAVTTDPIDAARRRVEGHVRRIDGARRIHRKAGRAEPSSGRYGREQ